MSGGPEREPRSTVQRLPHWLAPWQQAVEVGRRTPVPWRRGLPADRPARVRCAAVLVLLGEGPQGPDVLLTRRADTLRSHAGQTAFPGGRRDPEDADDVATALREAREEVGVDPGTTTPLGTLPPLWAPPSDHEVTTVIAWWHQPHPVSPVDLAEVAAVGRVPVADLVDPANRVGVRYPAGRGDGPGFLVGGFFVWGFTAGLLTWLLELADLAVPWDTTPVVDHEGSPLDDQGTA